MVLNLLLHLYFAGKFKIFISIYLISDLIFLFIIDIFCTTLIPQHYYKLNFYQYSEIIRSLMSIYFCGGYWRFDSRYNP